MSVLLWLIVIGVIAVATPILNSAVEVERAMQDADEQSRIIAERNK